MNFPTANFPTVNFTTVNFTTVNFTTMNFTTANFTTVNCRRRIVDGELSGFRIKAIDTCHQKWDVTKITIYEIRVGGGTIPGIKRDNKCFVGLYGKTKPSFVAHSPLLRIQLTSNWMVVSSFGLGQFLFRNNSSQ